MIKLHNIISLLQPYNIYQPKIRLGSNGDGGYIVSYSILNQCECLFTYGVGNNIDFELDFVRSTNKPCKMFDHTLTEDITEFIDWHVQHSGNLLSSYKEGLGNYDNCNSFENHYKQLQINGEVLLKIDVEGCEYDYFESSDMDFIKNVCSGILLEVHNIKDSKIQDRLLNILQKINENFIIFHLHGNNYGHTFNYMNFEIPNVLELSFINKRHVNFYEKYIDYSLSYLDFPNYSGSKDLSLDFLKIPMLM
jgi:hypothetical protein